MDFQGLGGAKSHFVVSRKEVGCAPRAVSKMFVSGASLRLVPTNKRQFATACRMSKSTTYNEGLIKFPAVVGLFTYQLKFKYLQMS